MFVCVGGVFVGDQQQHPPEIMGVAQQSGRPGGLQERFSKVGVCLLVWVCVVVGVYAGDEQHPPATMGVAQQSGRPGGLQEQFSKVGVGVCLERGRGGLWVCSLWV